MQYPQTYRRQFLTWMDVYACMQQCPLVDLLQEQEKDILHASVPIICPTQMFEIVGWRLSHLDNLTP